MNWNVWRICVSLVLGVQLLDLHLLGLLLGVLLMEVQHIAGLEATTCPSEKAMTRGPRFPALWS
jgi:hypothetical protein